MKKIILPFIVLVALLTLLVSACAAPTPTPEPTDELRIAYPELGTETLDPSLNASTTVKGFLLDTIYDGLVGVTVDGQLSKDTGLARDWKVENYATHSVYTFYLREGVKFHDGVEVTAEDVKFSLEHMVRPESLALGADLLKDTIIETPERYKVVITTKETLGTLVEEVISPIGFGLGIILPKHYIEQHGEDYFNANPIGTGPYKFKEQVIGSHLTLEAVDYEHWLYGVPKYQYLTFLLVPEVFTRIAMLRTGEIDIAFVGRETVEEVRDEFNIFTKRDQMNAVVRFMNFGPEDMYTRDVRVRQALSLAIDREAILEYIFQGQGSVTGDGPWGSWCIGYQPMPLVEYNPEEAKRLMAEAIQENGWDRVELNFYSIPRSAFPEAPPMTEAIASMWEQAFGDLIDVTIINIDFGTIWPKMVAKELPPNPVQSIFFTNRPFMLSFWRAVFYGGSVPAFYENGASPYVDRDLVARFDDLAAAVEIEEIARLQYEIAVYLYENHLELPIVALDGLLAADPAKIEEWDLGMVPHMWNLPGLFAQQ